MVDIACVAAQTIPVPTVAEIKVRLAEDEPVFDVACAYRLPPAVVAVIQSGAAWGQMCWWEAENICRETR